MALSLATNIAANRQRFLAALRSPDSTKGPIAVDARGRPVDPTAPGWCVDGLAYTLFHDPARPHSLQPVRAALGVSATPPRFSPLGRKGVIPPPLSSPPFADLIEAAWQQGRKLCVPATRRCAPDSPPPSTSSFPISATVPPSPPPYCAACGSFCS